MTASTAPDLIAQLDALRERIFAGDNTHCFVERQRVLSELAPRLDTLPAATPDGRLPGEPISENQSPVHGTDRAGVTALLRSVAGLPLERTPTGGLNLKLAFRPDPATALQLVESFFALGGIHLGFTFVDRATLLAAQARPAEFRSLCVRITGFSEFFTALSPAGQADIIARTEY